MARKNQVVKPHSVEPVEAEELEFVRKVANDFTCDNLGGMVSDWRQLYNECTEEEAEGVEEEHKAWMRVAKGMLFIAVRDALPLTKATAEKLWSDPLNHLGNLYDA